MSEVLVLNQNYQAISVCDPRRALVLVMLDKAELVCDNPNRKMHAINATFDYPLIIRLFTYVRLARKKVPLTRYNIFKRDGNKCVYCGSKDRLTVDHVIPKAKGGRTTWKNLVTACKKCNSKKADLSCMEAGLNLQTAPYRPSFILFISRFSGTIHEAWKPYLYF